MFPPFYRIIKEPIQGDKMQRTIKIDQQALQNFLYVYVKNITDTVQNINFYDTRLVLHPQQRKLIRLEKVHYNAFRNNTRGRVHIFEHNFKQDILIQNPLTKEKRKLDLLLEDGRPVIVFSGETILIQGVRLIDLYKGQVGRIGATMTVLPNDKEKLEIKDTTHVPAQKKALTNAEIVAAITPEKEVKEEVPPVAAPVKADAIEDAVEFKETGAEDDEDDNRPSSPATEVRRPRPKSKQIKRK
jgi:hypothetical protein